MLSREVRAGYALGGVATGAFATVPGLLLLPYLTERLAVPAAVAGVIVFVPKAWDVVLDPIAGRISDGRGVRRPFLIRSGLALAVLFALLFAGPTSPGALARPGSRCCSSAARRPTRSSRCPTWPCRRR